MATQSELRLVGQRPFTRRNPRVRVMLYAKLISTTDEINVTIRDVSLDGALVEGRRLPAVGRDIVLERGTFEVFARVVWGKENMCGLEFDGPLGRLQELLEASVGRRCDEATQKALSCPVSIAPVPLTAAEARIAAEWGQPEGWRASRD